MVEELTYEKWKKEHIDTNESMKKAWKSLVKISEKKKKDLINSFKTSNLEKEQQSTKIKEEQEKIAKAIFNVIRDNPCDFKWKYRDRRDDAIQRNIRTVRILDSKSRKTLQTIKGLKGVYSIHGRSINDYFIPIATKIKALKEAMDTSYRISGVNNGGSIDDRNGNGRNGNNVGRRTGYDNY